MMISALTNQQPHLALQPAPFGQTPSLQQNTLASIPNLSQIATPENIQNAKHVAKAISQNWLSDTIQLAKELWQKLVQFLKLVGETLHNAVRYIGKNPILLFAMFDGFHHH